MPPCHRAAALALPFALASSPVGLAGSEWQLRDVAGEPAEVEAWIGFKADDAPARRPWGSQTRIAACLPARLAARLARIRV